MSSNPEVLYEDAQVIVVHKPEGLPSIPERDPLLPNLRRYLEEQLHDRIFVVHRLDKEVSGVIAFAKNAAAHRELSLSFERREVEKVYLCALHGVLSKARRVEAPLREFGSGRVGVDPRGKSATTDYAPLRSAEGFSLSEARPETGRRHQIRAHAFHIGHPIVGDLRYGDKELQSRFERLMLHALRLSLKPSWLSAPLVVLAEPPPSFRAQLEKLGLGSSP